MTWPTLPDHLLSDLICAACFGFLLILVVSLGVKLADYLWRKLDLEEQVQKGNIAAGIVMGFTVFGLAIAVAIVIHGILN